MFYGKVYMGLAIMLILLLTGCAGKGNEVAQAGQGENSGAIGVQPGQRAPDFTLPDMRDEAVTLSAFQGKIIFLNFWATWCGPCREEMAALEQFSKDKAADVVLLGVNLKEDKETVLRFMQQGGYSYPVLRDSYGQVADQYQIRAIPTTYVIDKQGIIRQKKVGTVTADELNRMVEAARR